MVSVVNDDGLELLLVNNHGESHKWNAWNAHVSVLIIVYNLSYDLYVTYYEFDY